MSFSLKMISASDVTPYANAIISIINKSTGEDLTTKPREVLIISHKYSSVKTPTVRIKIDETLITRNNNLVVSYSCLKCNTVNSITLNLFVRKINKQVQCCDACKNSDPLKREAHSSYMKGERSVTHETRWSDKLLADRVSESYSMFEEEDDSFKEMYFLRHMSIVDFNRIKDSIVSIGNKKIVDLSGWDYIPTYRVFNQMKYTPVLVNLETNTFVKPYYIEWVCSSCDTQFINRDLEVQKNKYKILCKDCSFTNKTFKIRTTNTPWGKVRYQSSLEHRFIQWCIEKNIIVQNGPVVEYMWKEKLHKYRIDFQLPEHNRLVELKDNHVWHKTQVLNGKWGEKELAATSWCDTNGWKYDLVFPKTLASWKEEMTTVCKI